MRLRPSVKNIQGTELPTSDCVRSGHLFVLAEAKSRSFDCASLRSAQDDNSCEFAASD